MSCCCFADEDVTEGTRQSTRRILRSSSYAAAADNLTRIFEELKCPICFNVCVPPIHNCINGHIVCDNCRQKGNVITCPTCRESLLGARNYFAENFIVNYAQQCRYASQGCEHLRLKGCSMKPHEEKCIFRPVKCIVALCGLDIPYKNFLGHLDYAHKASGTTKLPTSVQFKYSLSRSTKKMKWLPFYIQAYGNVYYVMMQRVKKNYWIWAYSQTSKESDELEYNHYVYIKLKHPEKKITHSWHGTAYPIRTTFKAIMAEGCCFMLPELIMKNFVSDGMLNFTVDIKKRPRRSLKDVKLPGDDSDTAVASTSLPTEYNRPPSFYEPILPLLQPNSEPNASGSYTLNVIKDINNNNTIFQTKPTGKEHGHGRPKIRTAAIGIPGGFAFSPGTTTTSSLASVNRETDLEISLVDEAKSKNDEDSQEKISDDKNSSKSNNLK